MAPRYPIGIQNFETLRMGGFLYVDKTAHIYEMAKTQRYYLLTRPPLFGKSLLLSTIKAYFLGKKELFKGLEIEKLEKDWVEHPVLHLDLKGAQYDSVDSLEEMLNRHLVSWEELYGSHPAETMPQLRFEGVIERAYEKTGQRVVVLIDNHDEPLLQTFHNQELQKELCDILSPFYGRLKKMDGAVGFGLLTGVTEIESGGTVTCRWKNFRDISRSVPYLDVCGISEWDIQDYLEEDIKDLAIANKLTHDEACAKLKEYCGGYQFSEQTESVYNPYSFLSTLESKEFKDYWCEATRSLPYIAELLRQINGAGKKCYDLDNLEYLRINDFWSDYLYTFHDLTFLVYYGGYLTIQEYSCEGLDFMGNEYSLRFPNRHIEEGLYRYLMSLYIGVHSEESFRQFLQEIEKGEVGAIPARLQSFLAGANFELNWDPKLHLKNVLLVVCRVAGFYITVDYRLPPGHDDLVMQTRHVDLVMQTDRYIYIIEIRVNESAEEALRQIEEKQYALPFTSDPRKVYLIGGNYLEEKRNIEGWLVRQLN